MNINKTKKVRVRFPNLVSGNMVIGECTKQVMKLPQIQDINNRIYSEMFSGESGMECGARMLPKVEGFNCTWISDKSIYGRYVDAQFTFASSEEKKVMKIIDKYGGKIVNVRTDLNQNEHKEINGSGKENAVEQVNEVLKWL
jgi:hypothetical protein|tara:strand:+ start:2762 stop:3187 length:426 start_codon:yes stop_codon:yes gene_type:complete